MLLFHLQWSYPNLPSTEKLLDDLLGSTIESSQKKLWPCGLDQEVMSVVQMNLRTKLYAEEDGRYTEPPNGSVGGNPLGERWGRPVAPQCKPSSLCHSQALSGHNFYQVEPELVEVQWMLAADLTNLDPLQEGRCRDPVASLLLQQVSSLPLRRVVGGREGGVCACSHNRCNS